MELWCDCPRQSFDFDSLREAPPLHTLADVVKWTTLAAPITVNCPLSTEKNCQFPRRSLYPLPKHAPNAQNPQPASCGSCNKKEERKMKKMRKSNWFVFSIPGRCEEKKWLNIKFLWSCGQMEGRFYQKCQAVKKYRKKCLQSRFDVLICIRWTSDIFWTFTNLRWKSEI